jgi:hypothetical protein
VTDDATAAILRRARGYPYDAPHDSYTWDRGAVRGFDPADRDGRTPILAFGSNRAPERLHQKFAHLGDHLIPVEKAWLSDFDVVYAAHITSYGAVPAMLQRAKGVTCEIAVTWLDAEQVPIMHASEMSAANYVYARLDDVSLRLAGGAVMDRAFCYIGARGHLMSPDGGPTPLLAVHAEGRPTPGIATGEVLERIRERVAPNAEPDAFVLRLVEDKAYRAAVSDAISEDAVAFGYPATVLETG